MMMSEYLGGNVAMRKMVHVFGAPIRRSGAIGLVAVAAAVVGCSTSVGGHGAAVPGAPVAPTSSKPAPTTPPATTPSTTRPPQTGHRATHPSPPATTMPPAATLPPTSGSEVAAPAPIQCSDSGCPELSHSYVKDGYQIILRTGTPDISGTVTSVVELVVNGVPAQWNVESDEYAPHLTCSTRTPHLHCVLAAVVGAHGAQAQLYLAADGHFVLPPPVVTDTPDIRVTDLDGDGDLDLQVPVNDYVPDYADGGTYWETWLLHNQAYTRTGCTTTVQQTELSPPTTPVYGSCPG